MSSPSISAVANAMPRSGIRRFMDLSWSAGDHVIGLHAGEPNVNTPMHIIDGAISALNDGYTRYTPNVGIEQLRKAIKYKLKWHNNINVDADDIIVTAGGMQGIWLTLCATVEPGDEVLIPDPGWPNFRMAVELLGAKAVAYRLDESNDFMPIPEEIKTYITDRTKLMILNSPSNPIGTVTCRQTVIELVNIAHQCGIWLLSDECYDGIVYDGTHISPAEFDKRNHVISCFSFSKTYAMTGLRVGYVVVPSSYRHVFAKVQEPLVSCVNAPTQYAALSALEGPQDFVEKMSNQYKYRRDEACSLLDDLKVPYILPHGAFYIWINVSDRTDSVERFAEDAVNERSVAVIPGTAFGLGGEGYIRCSLASDLELILQGLRRLFK